MESSDFICCGKILGYPYRDFGNSYVGPGERNLLYLSLVRSHLSYASEAWAPQSSITDIKLLESVQKRSARSILSCSKDLKIQSRLLVLNLLPISYWLECRDLCFVFKCMVYVKRTLKNILKFV